MNGGVGERRWLQRNYRKELMSELAHDGLDI